MFLRVQGYVGARIWYSVSEQVAVTLVPGDRPLARHERSATRQADPSRARRVVDG